MKFSPGDKVSFINEKQNGVVIRSFEGGKVIVEIEDGFEIEVYEKELVRIGEEKLIEKKEADEHIVIPDSPVNSSLEICPTGTICFAAVPVATGAILTGMINYLIINNSDYDLVFTCFLKTRSGIKGLKRNVLEKQTEVLIDTFRRDDLTNVESFIIEALVYYNDKRPDVTHIRKEVEVMLPGVSHTLPGRTGVLAFSKVKEIFSQNDFEAVQIKDLIEKMSIRKAVNVSTSIPKKNDVSRYGLFVNETEVDLHIEELHPDFSNLTNAEMVMIQLKHFSKEMDNAIRNHYKRIIFIHGVGNGVLKREIRLELRKYNGVTVRDADHTKYGYGATEVTW